MKTIIVGSLLMISSASFADTLVVEQSGYNFTPQTINAAPGDTIRWVWGNGNHTMVDADLADPCQEIGDWFDLPLNSSDTIAEWVVPEEAAGQEIYYICDIGNHCDNEMVGYINVDEGDSDGGLRIGIVDIQDCNFSFSNDAGVESFYLSGSGDRANFTIGVEPEGDIAIETYAYGNVGIYQASTNTLTPLSGLATITLSSGEKYAFVAESLSAGKGGEIVLEFGYASDCDDCGPFIGLSSQGCSVTSVGDQFMFKSTSVDRTGAILLEGEAEITLSIAGAVTSDTLSLPAYGEASTVSIPAGSHTIELNVDEDAQFALLTMYMGEDGDGDGGGDDGSLPEDVNEDGIVDVSDLLAIIAAWGATSP